VTAAAALSTTRRDATAMAEMGFGLSLEVFEQRMRSQMGSHAAAAAALSTKRLEAGCKGQKATMEEDL